MSNPARLPDGVADLLDRTLGEANEPGILADWLDDHSEHWSGFAAALRASAPPDQLPGFADFRYQIVCPGVMFWVCEGEFPATKGKPRTAALVLGVYRAAPLEPGMWRRVVSPDRLSKAVRRRLWEVFDVSNWADQE